MSLFEQIVAPSGEGNPRNSEASAVERTNGEILLAYTDFYGGTGDDHDAARISAMISEDGGRTWGERLTLQDKVGQMNVMSVSLLRLQSGEIACVYARKNSMSDLRPFIKRSVDEGKTWSEAVPVVTDDGYSEMDNDRLVQMSLGRLLAPVSWSANVDLGHYISRCYYSDDRGRTWRRSANSVDVPGVGADEPAVVELKNGTVLMLFRTTLGQLWAAHSEDGGETWGEAYPMIQLVSPNAPVNIKRIPSTGDLLVIWNHHWPAGTRGSEPVVTSSERTPLTAAISIDEGKTWCAFRDLETDPDGAFAYPSILCIGEEVLLTYYSYDTTGQRQQGISLKLTIVPVRWFYGAL
ncbi:MAG: exo-alpha-sialidase [Candidatus Latescibacteria bacterium]|nr:exo-alpha-sialidase [Candidatus Latescibacterota bacterium]